MKHTRTRMVATCALLGGLSACGPRDSEQPGMLAGLRAAAAASAAHDPCALVDHEELERIREGGLFEGEPDGDTCRYDAKLKDGRIGLHAVTITSAPVGGADEVQAWRDGTGFLNATIRSATGMDGASTGDLVGLGDEAFFVSAGVMDFLIARKGDAFVKVEGMGPPEQAIAIARLALERL